MKEYVLSYYPQFKCIAEKCQHTCCAGWEMKIDSQTLNAYKNQKSLFSQTLDKGINYKKSKFKSDKKGRCAFLNDKGLCEIIINLGEQSLCQVCRDHPRFRSFFNDRTETGLGFCCEQATKIILSYKDKIQPVLTHYDENENQLDFNQTNVLEFRQKALDLIQDRNVDINRRIENLLTLCKANVLEKNYKQIIKTFLSFERLNKNWTARLKSIKNQTFNKTVDNSQAIYCEQFITNGIYRHLSNAQDTMWVRAITIGLILCWWIINNIIKKEQNSNTPDFNLIVDVVREYSAEVEYSENNLYKLYNFAYKFIKL